MTKKVSDSVVKAASGRAIDNAVERLSDADPVNNENKNGEPVALYEGDTGDRFLIYTTNHGVDIEIRYSREQPWFSQKQLADMFNVSTRNVGDHVNKFIGDGELGDSVTRKFRATAADGKSYDTMHYTLDVAFYVGYRVNSAAGVLFRRWATDLLVRFATKGFVVDKHRLKNQGESGTLDEFREIAREIRTSIQNSYREVLRLCTLCSDYNGQSDIARNFFMEMENKLLWAASQNTAPQLVIERCNATIKNLGLTYYAGKRGPTKRDVVIGNNYLAPGEAQTKNRITEMWLTYVEDQLDQGRLPTMKSVQEKLDGFIKFNQWPQLQDRGRHKRSDADRHAHEQYRLYTDWQRAVRNEESD